MTQEKRGLVIDGNVIHDSEWIRRAPGAWWEPGDRGTRPRKGTVDIIMGHWTAGEAGAKSYEDDGEVLARVMKHRDREVGIHFVIGAGPQDETAWVWQLADPGKTATIHVGKGWINSRSIGVEVVSCGVPGKTNARGRPEKTVKLLGRNQKVVEFYPSQIEAWVKLATLLSGKCLPTGIEIPRTVPSVDGDLMVSRRMTHLEARLWHGAMEHFLMPDTTKIDAGGMLIGALHKEAGWEMKEVG